ncbi:MAG: hypothetical protein J7L86_06805 [Candidatus Marinimicrobia bacterium]|nr:hypothetical protein [Candidatus Neomarinimicrobiota bacterium]
MAGGYLLFSSPNIRSTYIKEIDLAIQNLFKILSKYISFLLDSANKESKLVNGFVPNIHIANIIDELIDSIFLELYFEEEFKRAGITFIPYVERDFPSIEGLNDEEKIETIRSVYQKLRQKDNEIMNNLKLMDIRLADLIGPIKAVG